MKPVDSHCHIDFDQFEEDREAVIARSKERLDFIVVAGSNLEHNRKASQLERKHEDFIKSNLGLHPTYTDSFSQINKIKKQIRDKDPVAIGEIGLDHHHVKKDEKRSKQRKIFEEMLDLAEELDKPVVIHSREAETQAIDILETYNIDKIMLHCFNGKPKLAEKATDLGMKIGVTTQVLYSERVKSIVEKIKLEDILLETDSPFLYRGDRNEPVNVIESADKIADIKGLNTQEVVDTTTNTASEFFN